MEAAGVLATTFGLGLLLHASQAALFTAINGHIKTLLFHRRRLVLLSFLLCISAYSVFQFASLLLLGNTSCSVTVRFTLFFDQAARISVLALIVWKVCEETENTGEKVYWVAVLGLRILLGGIIVGFTGWTFMPVCFPQPVHSVTGIINVTFDGLCWGILLFRIITFWCLFSDQGRGGKADGKSQGYGLFLIVLSFIGWTIGSFPYLMNLGESIFVRMIPYIITLVLALGVLGCFPSIVCSVPTSRPNGLYSQQFGRFGPSPLNTTRAGQSIVSPDSNPGDIESHKTDRFPLYGMNSSGARTSIMFRSIIGAPIVHPSSAMPWSLEAHHAAENITKPKPTKSIPESKGPRTALSHSIKFGVSGPAGSRMRDDSFEVVEQTPDLATNNSFPNLKIRTVSLKTAAEMERQRIDAEFERGQERRNHQAGVTATPKLRTECLNTNSSASIKRKPLLPQFPSGSPALRVSVVKIEGGVSQSSSIIQRSALAGSDGGTRYSVVSLGSEDDDTTRYTAISHAPYTLAAPPRIPRIDLSDDDPKVMFLNEIVYDDPALVKSIMGKADVASTTSRYSESKTGAVRRSPSSITKRLPGLSPAENSNDSVIASPQYMGSSPVMDRPRSVKNIAERGIFPPNRDSDLAAQMQYNKKQSIIRSQSKGLQADSEPLPEASSLKVRTEKNKAREIVFPTPPSRSSSRKGVPPPVTVIIPKGLPSEMIAEVTTVSRADAQSIPSPKPEIPEKSQKRLIGPAVNDPRAGFAAYETARAWAESVSAVNDESGYARSIIETLPSIAYDMSDDITPRIAAAISDGNHKRQSLMALTVSPISQIEDDIFTDIEIDSGSEDGDDQNLEEANVDSGSDDQTQSEADEMIMNGGEGYSTEDESYGDLFTDSEKECYLDDGIFISDMEEGTNYDKITIAEQKLDDKVQEDIEALKSSTPISIHFRLGDSIPTFSESRRKYGTKRKPPPSPIKFLVQQKRSSKQQMEARLTIFAGTQHLAPLEDLMNRLPVNKKADSRVSYQSDGRNSLLARLESEMGQQENEWMKMHKTLERSSIGSLKEATENRALRLSRNLAQRHTPKISEGIVIDRRFDARSDAESVCSDTKTSAWHSRMEYLVQAPLVNPGEVLARPFSILESQGIPTLETSEFDGRAYDFGDESRYVSNRTNARRGSFYASDSPSFFVEDQEISEEETEIQLLEPTVYCPSIRSAGGIISRPPLIYSITSEPFTTGESSSPVSLLWNSRLTGKSPTTPKKQLWKCHVRLPRTPLGLPAAPDLRPKRRISTAPISKATTSLWTKTRSPQSNTGLWRSDVEQEPENIILSSIEDGKNRPLKIKTVTLAEDMARVKTIDLFRKFKKHLGGHTSPLLADTSINTILDFVGVRYANKKLTPPPPKKDVIEHKDPRSLRCNHLWSQQSSLSTVALLWSPKPVPEFYDTQLFLNGIPSLHRRTPQQAFVPTLISNKLWGCYEQPMMLSLWKTNSTSIRSLWPHGEVTVVDRSCLWPFAPPAKKLDVATRYRSQAITRITNRQSSPPWAAAPVHRKSGDEDIILWKPVKKLVFLVKKDTGLWVKKQASVASGHLWPCASDLPVLAVLLPITRSCTTSTTLPTLKPSRLWSSTKDAVRPWPPKGSTGLWPHGSPDKVVSCLWPSAAALSFMLVKSSTKRARFMIVNITELESYQLWTHPEVQSELEVEGMWKPATVVAKPIIVDSPSAKTLPNLLWTAPEQASHAVISSYLWPLAPPIPLPRISPTIKPRNPTKSSIVSLSGNLWSSTPALTPHLWSAPISESTLWPHGKLRYARTGTLWPSAPLLTSTPNQPPRTVRIIVTTMPIESSQLWSADAATKAELWAPHPQKIGLWPNGEVKRKFVGLWPSAAGLKHESIAPIRVKQRRPISLPSLESRELWGNSKVHQSLWKKIIGQRGLWPQGAYSSGKEWLWSADSNMQSIPRGNFTLKLETVKSRKRYERKAITARLESCALWDRPIDIRLKSAGRLWSKEIEDIGELPKTKAKEDDVALVSPGLWAYPSPVSSPSPANLMTPVAALWTALPLESPRIQIAIYRDTISVAAVRRKKSAVDASLTLTHMQGNLWVVGTQSLLSGGSTPPCCTGVKQAPQGSLWNSAKKEKKVPLWHRRTFIGKDRGAVKQQTTTTIGGSYAAKSDQLRDFFFISAETETERDSDNHVHHDGLWTAKKKPLLVRGAPDTVPRERTFVTPRTCTLWKKNKSDKAVAPIFPASVMIIPVVPSRSNKRAASNILPPLFLASVGGPMWTADKTSDTRPCGLLWCQTESEGTETKGLFLWQPNNKIGNKYDTITAINKSTLPVKKSHLWSFSGTKPERQSIFQNLSVGSVRGSPTRTTRNHNTLTNPMEGSLWVKPRNTTPEKPKLWRKTEFPQRLWAAENNLNSSNNDMTITTKAAPSVAKTQLWGKDNVATTPIFADLSLESSRSRREFTPKSFSAPPEGLWKKAVTSEPQVMALEVPAIGLWGVTETAPTFIKNVSTKTLWQKGNTEAPLFADLSVESFRSRKDHSTATLPVFSEGMWKRKVALPERPQLWKPTPKATGLWDANAKTKTLAQISLERKAKGTKRSLWSKEKASRTTAKLPQRSPLAVVRISDDFDLPKATGDLWKPKSPTSQAPELWTAPKSVVKPTEPAKLTDHTKPMKFLWGQRSESKTTTAAVPERTKVPFIPSDDPLPTVSGSLWKPKSTAKPAGLWRPSTKKLATAAVNPSAPLWAAGTASRTTSAVPQRLPIQKKKDTRSLILPPATGSLWQPPKRIPEKGLWRAPARPARRPRSASLLWASHSASRTTTAVPVRTTVPKRLIEEPLRAVSGILWKALASEPKKGLWKRTIPTVATYRRTSTMALWSKESASRTTSAKPECAPFVPKVVEEKSLALSPATGNLWAPSSSTTPQTVSLWSPPVTPSSGSGVWDAQGRTPTLAEIKLSLATRRDKTELWQRRSVLTSKPAIVDISKITSSTAPQKKAKTAEPASTPQVDGSLWRPCVDGKNENGIMWITRSSRSSSLESEFISPGVSRASTISDMSDETESPLTTSNAELFEPEVMRIHSTKVSVSFAAGEHMWRPMGVEEGKGKEATKPEQKEQDATRSLWTRPSTDEEKAAIWENPNSYACSSVSDEDFASAASEISEESHYHDFETTYEPDSYSNNTCPPSSNPHVFVGQFHRDNYLFHQQPNTQLPENSPFASNLRIKSLRRKLRPTHGAHETVERKRRNTEGEEERERLKVDSIPMERAVSMGDDHL